jgi:hypothetical protein
MKRHRIHFDDRAMRRFQDELIAWWIIIALLFGGSWLLAQGLKLLWAWVT